MFSILTKEINTFFSSLIAYIVIGVFLVILWLIMFIFPDTSLLDNNYATLSQLFDMAPLIFMFLIPAITMRSFAEEHQSGTFEFLATRPLREIEIVLGKFFACLFLVVFALIPTVLYYYTVYELGEPKGNLDSGAIMGSYLGLFFLASAFVAIGIFASSLTKNQIIAFILATFLCFLFHWGFFYFSELPLFVGKSDDLIQMIGIDYHYRSISRGLIDSRDMIYFVSISALFILLTLFSLERRKW